MSHTIDEGNGKEGLLPAHSDHGEPLGAQGLKRPNEADPVEVVAPPPGAVEPAGGSPSVEAAEEQPRTPAISVDHQLSEAVVARLAKLPDDVRELRELLATTQARLASLEAAVDTTAKQLAFLPPQVRMLGSKIDGLATSISEPRYRAVLLSLLGVYDLVDQVLRTLPPPSENAADADHRRNYEILRTQLHQLLEANGLSEIATDGGFDPTVQRAMQRVPCDDPAQADHVLAVVRPGFRTEQSILRFAEVLVGQYVPRQTAGGEDGVAGAATETQL